MLHISPVGDLESAVHGSLHGAKHACAGGGPGQTHIQVAPEGGWLPILQLILQVGMNNWGLPNIINNLYSIPYNLQ